MLEDYLAHQERCGSSFWATIERASGQLIGDAGLYHGEDGSPEIELGYTHGRAWWGRGYATEAPQRAATLRSAGSLWRP